MPTVAEGMPGTSSESSRSPLSSTVRCTISVLPLRTLAVLLHFTLAQTNLALAIDLQHLDHDLIAFSEHVGHSAHATSPDLRDVQQTICPRENLDERAKVHHLAHSALVDPADLRLSGNAVDPLHRSSHRVSVLRGDIDRAVVFDIDLDARFLDDRANHFSAWADDLADLLGFHFECYDARRVLRHLGSWRGERLRHLSQDMQPSFLSLVQGLLHNLACDAGDLDVHLQGGDALGSSSDLEIHIAEMVFIAQNVAQDADLFPFFDQAHGDPGHRRFDRHTGIHERECSPAHRGH